MPAWTRTVIIIITVLVDFFVTITTFCQRKGFIFFLIIVLSVKISVVNFFVATISFFHRREPCSCVHPVHLFV
jgi:hypothetical protein